MGKVEASNSTKLSKRVFHFIRIRLFMEERTEDSTDRDWSLNLSVFLVPRGDWDPVVSDRFYGSDDPSSIVSMVSLTSYKTRGHIAYLATN